MSDSLTEFNGYHPLKIHSARTFVYVFVIPVYTGFLPMSVWAHMHVLYVPLVTDGDALMASQHVWGPAESYSIQTHGQYARPVLSFPFSPLAMIFSSLSNLDTNKVLQHSSSTRICVNLSAGPNANRSLFFMLIWQEPTNLAACYAEGYFNLPLAKAGEHYCPSAAHSSFVFFCVISPLSFAFFFLPL